MKKGSPLFMRLMFILTLATLPVHGTIIVVKKCPIDTIAKVVNYVFTANGKEVPMYAATSPKGSKHIYVWLKSDEKVNFKLTGYWQGHIQSIMHTPMNQINFKQSDPNYVNGVPKYRIHEFSMNPGNHVIMSNGNDRIFVFLEKIGDQAYDTTGPNAINVRSAPYNADNTGNSLASTAIQKAIDDASASATSGKQKVVYVPEGIYEVGTIFIKSNVNLHLAEGTLLRYSKRPEAWKYDYAYDRTPEGSDKDWWSSSMIFFKSFKNDTVRNARISGWGVLDGGCDYFRSGCTSGDFCYERDITKFSKGIFFQGAYNCVSEGVMMRNIVFWNMHILGGAYNRVQNIKILGNYMVNNDGIDFDNTQHCRVDNCVVIASDDGTCLKSNYIYGYYKPNMYDSVTNSIFTAPGFPTIKFGWALHKNYFCHFENVHVEEYMKWEITKKWFQGCPDPAIKNDNRVVVSGLTFKNVKINGDFIGNKGAVTDFYSTNNKFVDCEIGGAISLFNFDTLKFINVKRAGKPLTNESELGVAPVSCKNITFSYEGTSVVNGKHGTKIPEPVSFKDGSIFLNGSGNDIIEITDMSGRTIYSSQVNSKNVLKLKTKGIYMVNLHDKNTKQSKIMKFNNMQ